jgi:hypothetical protein
MQEVSETSAESEVVTTWSRQVPGKARLHSVAMILIVSIPVQTTLRMMVYDPTGQGRVRSTSTRKSFAGLSCVGRPI